MAAPKSQPSPSATRPQGAAPETPEFSQSPTQGWPAHWQQRNVLSWSLWPLSQLYRALMAVRRALYRAGVLKSEHPHCPVIVVGNVVAGGSGKTPIVMALVHQLLRMGFKPGVVSRGYGRTSQDCRVVSAASTAAEVGDEPLLIARQCGVPVCVASDRPLAGRTLLAQHPEVNVLLCDDGMQHLALQRDLEICVFNPHGIGNGFLLPAGPLREPWPRSVDWVLYNGPQPPDNATAAAAQGVFPIQRHIASRAVNAHGEQIPLAALQGQPLHALAAIGQPGLFFDMLKSAHLTLSKEEALPDHYDFDSWTRPRERQDPLICTEKDAVKLWKRYPLAWAVPLQLTLAPEFVHQLQQRLSGLASPLSSHLPIVR